MEQQQQFDIEKAVDHVMMLYLEGNFSKSSWAQEILTNFAKAVENKDCDFYKPYVEEEDDEE